MVARIKQLLDWQQLSPTQFADRIGIGRPVISHILSERNKPSLDVVRSIKAAFPEVSTDWLLDGIGPMLVSPVPTARVASAPAAAVAPVLPGGETAVPASAPTLVAAPGPTPVAMARPAIARFSVNSIKAAPAPTPVHAPSTEPAAPAPTPPAAAEPVPISASARPAAPSLADVFNESGKAIRRIVIFHRDGSFADYQPEE